MPIPTDTFWNIKRLNWIFAFSAIVLMAVTAWSILQDHDKSWRVDQRQARVWDAALTNEKLATVESDKATRQQLDTVQKQLEAADAALQPKQKDVEQLEAQIRELVSQRATLEFALNNKKSSLGVLEGHLQDASASGDAVLLKQLTDEIQQPRKEVEDATEYLANKIIAPLDEARNKLRLATAQRDAAAGAHTKLLSTQESLKKKLVSLNPETQGGITGLLGKLSDQIRNAPLMDFVNPSERVDQKVLPDVLTDVAFMKITTLDRCMTCHVNIAKKEFAADKVIAYLEEESVKAHHFALPDAPPPGAAAAAATKAKPGPVAMPEFWQMWTAKLAPDVIKKQAGRINTIVALFGKGATLSIDGKAITGFKYNAALNDSTVAAAPASAAPTTAPAIDAVTQNNILTALLDAAYRFDSSAAVSTTRGKIKIEIPTTVDKTAINSARNVGMRYVEELKKGLDASLPTDQRGLVDDRYRHALTDAVNPMRRQQGFAELDASPVLLAHPRLDLYCDADSSHPVESQEKTIGVGCTSCHDGSGQETDFVLTAHVPREIMVDRETGVPVPTELLPAKESEGNIDRATMASMLSVVAPKDSLVPKEVGDIHIHLADAPRVAPAVAPSVAPAVAGKNSSEMAGESSHPSAEKTPVHKHGEAAGPVSYVDPLTAKPRQAVTQMAYWKAKYEPEAPRDFALVYHEWDWPMRPPQLIQANCARCHTGILDIKDEAPTLYEGRQLFAELGCVNCHAMNSVAAENVPKDARDLDPALVMSNNRVKIGPNLTHVTSKLSPAFINTWIWAPKAFRPSTKMPHFFMLENNSSDEEIRRTRQEARSITEYLVQTADPLPIAHPIPSDAKGTIDGGKAVFNAIGCQACHANLNDPQPEKRGSKNITLAEKWIVSDLVKAHGQKKEEAEKLYDEMTYNERQTYVKEHFEEEPGATQAQRDAKKYSDGTLMPVFIHVGPELSGIGTKLLAGRAPEQARQWLFDWLKEPRHYSAYTIMPQLRLSDQQAIDLVEYLLNQKRTNDKADDPWKEGLAAVDSQKQIELVSLFLRSQYSAITALAKADDDANLTDLAVDALKRTTKTADEEKAATDEAKARVAKLSKDEKRMVWLGKKLIGNYGCMSCHAINGTEKITSPCADLSDWGQKAVDKLGYDYLDPHKAADLPAERPIMMVNGLSAQAADLAHETINFASQKVAAPVEAGWPLIEHLRTDWLAHKLKNTRVYDRGKALLEPNPASEDPLVHSGKPYDKLKMPTFYLNDEQVHQLVTFVISNRDKDGKPWLVSDRIAAKALTDQAKMIARGRELTTKFNCVSCHWIEHNAPQVQQYYKQDELLEKAPPPIRGEGNKIKFAWLFNFFKDVQNLRPLLYQHDGIRMPSFPATDEEWTAIITYFNSISNKESKQLAANLDLVTKYVMTQREKAAAPLPPADQAWPGDDWYTHDEFAQARQQLYEWSQLTKNMAPIEFDPSKNTPVQLGRAYRQALFKAHFTQDLYNSPYPFVESGEATQLSDARYQLGEELFQQMQCLSCHYLGNPDAPGAVKEPKAPNLALAHDRLQRRWVRHWVQEPPVIQPNTKMPAFFSGLGGNHPTYDLRGQTWSEATGRPQDEVDFYNARYGKTADEQAGLVLDFLFAAGARNATVVQTPIDQLPKPPSATPATQPAAPTTAPTTAPSG